MPTQLVGSGKDSRSGTTIGSLTVASARPEQTALDVRGGFAKEVATRGDLLAIATTERSACRYRRKIMATRFASPTPAPARTEHARVHLRRGRCRVYAVDVPLATKMELHNSYLPCAWEHNQFAADEQLHRLVRHGHPWLVADPKKADAVVLTGHGFARWCVASTILRNKLLEEHEHAIQNELRAAKRPAVDGGELCGNPSDEPCGLPQSKACSKSGRLFRSETAKRRLWDRMHEVADELNTTAPRIVVHLNNECPPAWGPGVGPQRHDTLMLVDRARRPQDGVVPFVLSRPAWLVGSVPVPAELSPPPWHARKLVLFAGHVPKLYISTTRYLLWRAWRRDPRVSIHTKDIACSLRAHSICRAPERWESEHDTFCQADCHTSRSCKPNAMAMKRECATYKHVDWDEELSDVERTSRGLSRSDYFKAAMSHRFCVIAPGDFPSTPKITEFVAIGAAGGW